LVWEDLRLQMLERSNACYAKLQKKTKDYSKTITERLQYEVSHSSAPQRWWEQDFRYKLKVELTNMAVGVENMVSKTLTDDARWFNASLEKSFQTHVLCANEEIIDKDFANMPHETGNITFEDIDKKRNMTRIGTTALSIVGFAAFTAIGFLPIVATMGIGTGSSIISENVFKKKLESQRDEIRAVIAKDVPGIVTEATQNSETRVKALYNDMINSAIEQEKLWKNSQLNAIEETINAQANNAKEIIDSQIVYLEDYCNKFSSLVLSAQG